MRRITDKRFYRDERGAVAVTYALSLVGLIAIMGVGFDYARVMGMDSELQNGADQAALAGATQLDGRTGACSRASTAIVNLLANRSVLASDNKAVTIPAEATCDGTGQIRFFQDKAKSLAATTDDNANYVEVIVDARAVDYAFLPITGLLRGNMQAMAFAGLGSSLCKVPPVMMCNPNEATDPEFTTANYAGFGVRLIANDQGGLYGPGVFGYLETNAGNGAIATGRVLGREDPPGDCISTDGADVKPGEQISVLDALNTRVGVYANGLNNVCGQNNALCPPPANARIDLLQQGGSCAIGPSGFTEGPNPYRPTDPINNIDPTGLDPMGFPRDKCHAVSPTGSCPEGPMGNGNWDRNAYYTTNAMTQPPVDGTTGFYNDYGYTELANRTSVDGPTRYQQYRYEFEQSLLSEPPGTPAGYDYQAAPLCHGPGLAPGSTPDRRILTIAVINCTDEMVGSSTTDAAIQKFVDVFMVEPSARRGSGSTLRTEASDVYVEVIGETILGGGASQGQEVRKDVPYLIE